MSARASSLAALGALVLASALASSLTACSSSDSAPANGKGPANAANADPKNDRVEGQTDFASALPIGQSASFGGGGGGADAGASASAGSSSGGTSGSAPTAGNAQDSNGGGGTASVTPQETDIYRVENNRLYYLNQYRGLMVFDISNVDNPKLIARSPVYGTPVEMFVEHGIATMVIGDWYGTDDDGSPFHGSIVRTVDAHNAADVRTLGEVHVKGWARDMRVVGSNLFIVSEDYGWIYGGLWGFDDVGVSTSYGGSNTSKVVLSSVGFGNRPPVLNATKVIDGDSGAFNVSANAILLAHDVYGAADANGYAAPTGTSELELIGFDLATGGFTAPVTVPVSGMLSGWTADNGRWNIDYDPDTKIGAAFTCTANANTYCNGTDGYELTTIDFGNAAGAKVAGNLHIPSATWQATARFSNHRMYLAPTNGYWAPNGEQQATPIQIYDLTAPATPKLAGSTTIDGAVWLFMPVDTDRLFSVGNTFVNQASTSEVAVSYFDVADATQPKLIGTSSFGDGWAWTPAAGTFKAFVRDATQKLVVLPFSGWNPNTYDYANGVQIIQYDTNSITTAGAANSKGWVERGIFANGRIISLSDQALSVVDYTDKMHPRVTKELTLARNILTAQPQGSTIVDISSDWWGYDNQTSDLRVHALANAEDDKDEPTAKTVSVPGTDPHVFRNGDLAYVVTTEYPNQPNTSWYQRPHVQVVDLANGNAIPRGSVSLPDDQNSNWYWSEGWSYDDWYDGSSAMQVGGDTLAFRRIHYNFDYQNGTSDWTQQLYLVDIQNPDAPTVTSTVITNQEQGWWGNMRVVGNTLYTSHWEWLNGYPWSTTSSSSGGSSSGSTDTTSTMPYVKYYLDQIDLSDRAHPKVGRRINVPGLLVGASDTDPSLLYFVDYRWYSNWSTSQPKDEIAIAKIQDDKAYLQSSTLIDGWVGDVFVRGSKAYASAQTYTDPNGQNPYGQSQVRLHQLDATDPKHPVDSASAPKVGWGWLLGVEGDRAIITSGWGNAGLDIYKLTPGQAPVYSQFARTRGWWASSLSRQDDDLYIATGYWGVQKITLR